MSSPPREPRNKRSNSVYAFSASSILNAIKSKIKHIDDKNSSSKLGSGCVVVHEEIFIKKKMKKYRRVVLTDNNYKIGWVVDSDFSFCMICLAGFGWLNLKHHCRSCGLLVCYSCTPYTAQVNNLFEEGGSRVCVNCFGLRIQPVDSPTVDSSNNSHYSHHNYDHLEEANRPSIGNRMVVSRTELSLETLDVDLDVDEKERAMIPLYEEAYNTMRQFIPLDIFQIEFEQLLMYGVPEAIADRVWNNKILWLIVMHPDDIAKLHLAELRTKYLAENLDIIELRAVWYNVPGWDSDESDGSSKVLQAGKNKWRAGLKARLNQLTELEARGQLMRTQLRNEVYTGYDDKYLFDPEVSLYHESDVIYHNGATSTSHHIPFQSQAMYGSAPTGSVLTSLLSPAENLYGSRYSNTSITHDALNDAMRIGAAPHTTSGKVTMTTTQRTSITNRRSSTNNNNNGNGTKQPVGRQQILHSDEDDTIYPPILSSSLPNSHYMDTSMNSQGSNQRYDLNLSMNSNNNNNTNNSNDVGRGLNDSNDFYIGSNDNSLLYDDQSFQFDPQVILLSEEEIHQQYLLENASKALNENTNRVLSQFYQQQYEEQQMKLKIAQEQKQQAERVAREKSAARKKQFTNTGSRSRSTSKK